MVSEAGTLKVGRAWPVVARTFAVALIVCLTDGAAFVGWQTLLPPRGSRSCDVVDALLGDRSCHGHGVQILESFGCGVLFALLWIPALYVIMTASRSWASGRCACACGKAVFTEVPMAGPIDRRVCSSCGKAYEGSNGELHEVAAEAAKA